MAATTPRTRKSPAKPTTIRPRSIVDAGRDDGFEPLRFTSPPEEVVEDRVTIAYLDDYALTMPRKVPPHIALKIMRTSRLRGDEVAMGEMLEEVIGEDAYMRLANYKALTDDDLANLMKVVQKVSMGALEIPKASSASA